MWEGNIGQFEMCSGKITRVVWESNKSIVCKHFCVANVNRKQAGSNIQMEWVKHMKYLGVNLEEKIVGGNALWLMIGKNCQIGRNCQGHVRCNVNIDVKAMS